jgi:hypothetical protein
MAPCSTSLWDAFVSSTVRGILQHMPVRCVSFSRCAWRPVMRMHSFLPHMTPQQALCGNTWAERPCKKRRFLLLERKEIASFPIDCGLARRLCGRPVSERSFGMEVLGPAWESRLCQGDQRLLVYAGYSRVGGKVFSAVSEDYFCQRASAAMHCHGCSQLSTAQGWGCSMGCLSGASCV